MQSIFKGKFAYQILVIHPLTFCNLFTLHKFLFWNRPLSYQYTNQAANRCWQHHHFQTCLCLPKTCGTKVEGKFKAAIIKSYTSTSLCTFANSKMWKPPAEVVILCCVVSLRPQTVVCVGREEPQPSSH